MKSAELLQIYTSWSEGTVEACSAIYTGAKEGILSDSVTGLAGDW